MLFTTPWWVRQTCPPRTKVEEQAKAFTSSKNNIIWMLSYIVGDHLVPQLKCLLSIVWWPLLVQGLSLLSSFWPGALPILHKSYYHISWSCPTNLEGGRASVSLYVAWFFRPDCISCQSYLLFLIYLKIIYILDGGKLRMGLCHIEVSTLYN